MTLGNSHDKHGGCNLAAAPPVHASVLLASTAAIDDIKPTAQLDPALLLHKFELPA
jgi:hypothetical protein